MLISKLNTNAILYKTIIITIYTINNSLLSAIELWTQWDAQRQN